MWDMSWTQGENGVHFVDTGLDERKCYKRERNIMSTKIPRPLTTKHLKLYVHVLLDELEICERDFWILEGHTSTCVTQEYIWNT